MHLDRLQGVFGTPSVKRLLACTLLADLPAGMVTLAIILRVTQAGGSYARGGLISGVTALGVGVSAPIWSRVADRRGQPVVLVPTAVAVATFAVLLSVLPPTGPLLPLLGAAMLMGLAQPPAQACVRALWPTVVREPRLLETTYSVDSALSELVFIVGPLLAVTVTAVAGPAAAVAASGLLAGVGAVGLAASRAVREAPRHPTAVMQPRRGALRSPSVRLLVLAIFVMVTAFAAIDVSTVAAARRHGGNGAAGVLIAIWGVGSLLGGLAFGSRGWPGRRSTKIIALLTAITVTTAALTPLSSLVALAAVLFVSGWFYAPAFSCINQAVQRTSLPGAVTESFAWLASGSLAGAAVGSTVGGAAVTAAGSAAGYGFAAATLVVAVSILLAGRRMLRAGDHESDRTTSDAAARALAPKVS